VRQLVHGECGNGIDAIIIDGNVIMQSGRLTAVDEASLISEFQAAHAQLRDHIEASEVASRPLLEGLGRVYRKSLTVGIPQDVTRGVIDMPPVAACAS